MNNRLVYETKGGQVSPADHFAKLLEYLRMAEESAYTLGHIAKANSDDSKGMMWFKVGEQFKRMQSHVTVIATAGRM